MLNLCLIGLLFLNAIWLLLVLFALPGNWLMVISTGLLAWWQWDQGVFSVYTLIAIGILAAIGEIFEFFAGVGGAKKAGASWPGALAAIAGAIIGAIGGTILIPIPILGTFLGACIGGGLGTLLIEFLSGKKLDHSMKSAFGAGFGVFLGTGSKFMLGIAIWLIIAIAAFK